MSTGHRVHRREFLAGGLRAGVFGLLAGIGYTVSRLNRPGGSFGDCDTACGACARVHTCRRPERRA